jgi:integrase
MATEKVGIYRKWHGPIPTDGSGKPLPPAEWHKKRLFSWAVRWFGIDGKRYSKSFRNRREGEEFAETKQSEVRVGRADPPPSIRLSEFIKEHGKVMQGQVAPASLYCQMRALKVFAGHVGDSRLLDRITPRDAEAFVAVRLQSGVSVATVNKDIRTLRRIFNLAIEPRGYLLEGQNPFRKIKQRKYCLKPIRYITPQEFKSLCAAATNLWWKALLSVAYTTGARIGEVLNLTWPDLDFEANRIRIDRKGGEVNTAAWEPKDHEGRLLPTPLEVMQLLANLHTDSADGCPYVFLSPRRWEHLKKVRKAGTWIPTSALVNNLNRNFAVLRKRAGVVKCTFHDLRRSCITNWARHLPAHVVQKLAGHSDIKTTQVYYLAVQEDDLERARQVQSAILNGDPTDPLLTHFGQNRPFSGQPAEGSDSQVPCEE